MDDRHPITVKPADRRWRVKFGGHVIADSNEAVVLQEAGAQPVVYFPRRDVATEYMSDSKTRSHCPYKGDASYLTILFDGELVEDIAWTYPDPKPDAHAIADHIAFYPDQVEIYSVDDAEVNPRHKDRADVDTVVRHTDSGSGQAQARPLDGGLS